MPHRRRHLGQHFLADADVADRIVAEAHVGPDDIVLEIGPGKGVLTHRLTALAKKVVAVEQDTDLARELIRHGAPNLEVVRGDAVRTELPPFDRCVSNLPYQISSPITFKLLEQRFKEAVLMYQLEFARRLVAPPGHPEYSRLSVNAAYAAECRILFHVPPGAFRPSPRVMSAVVRLTPRAEPPFHVEDETMFHRVVEAAFSQRRKMLRNGLLNRADFIGAPRDVVAAALDHVAYDKARPETLTPEQFGDVANAITGGMVR